MDSAVGDPVQAGRSRTVCDVINDGRIVLSTDGEAVFEAATFVCPCWSTTPVAAIAGLPISWERRSGGGCWRLRVRLAGDVVECVELLVDALDVQAAVLALV